MEQQGRLSNGIRYICHHTGDQDQTVAIFIAVRYGSAMDPPAQAGMAHLLEHMLFKGNKTMRAFEAIGARFNAFTDRTVTAYHAKCAQGHLETALDLLCDMVTSRNNFRAATENENENENVMRREKQIVANELRGNLDSSTRRVVDALYKNMFAREMARNLTEDSLAALPALTPAQLVAAYKKYYVAENITVSLCGNLKNHKVVALLHKYLGHVSNTNNTNNTNNSKSKIFMRAEAHLRGQRRRIVVPSLVPNPKQRTIMVVFPTHGFRWRHTQYYYTEMFGSIFANLTSGRLFQRLREQEGLVYSVKASQAAHDYVGYFAIKTTTAPQNVAAVVRILDQEMARVRAEGISAAEFVLARDNFLATWAMAQENPMTLAMYNASELFYKNNNNNNNNQNNHSNNNNFVPYEQVLTSLIPALTRAEMNRYLPKLLNPHAALLLVC